MRTQLRTQAEWWEYTMKHGTSGDQVHNILMDWQAEQERVAQVLKLFLSLATDAKCIQSVKWTAARDTGRSLLAKLEGGGK